MEFHKEYEILSSINSDKIMEIAFTFNSHIIKLYFAQKADYEFLTLVCENDKYTFVKNYGIYFINGIANINGFWGKYFEYAMGLQNNSNTGFSEFYKKLKESIRSIQNPNVEYMITYLSDGEGIARIRNANTKSPLSDEPIYFHYVRRQQITPKQFEKVKDLLGVDVAKLLSHSNLTAVFTSDITKQKTFILVPR